MAPNFVTERTAGAIRSIDRLGAIERDGIPDLVTDDFQHIGQGEVVNRRVALERDVKVRISVDDRLGNGGNSAGDLDLRTARRRLISGKRTGCGEHLQVALLSRRNRGTRGDALVMLHVDHGVHLDQAGIVFQRHEIGRAARRH